jgi:hypothetical protein
MLILEKKICAVSKGTNCMHSESECDLYYCPICNKLIMCHTRFLCQNQVLIVCMTQNQMFHTYSQKSLQKTKCHNIKYNYYRNIVFIN